MEPFRGTTSWLQKGFFIAFVFSLFGAFFPLQEAINLQAARDRRETIENYQISLSNATLSQAEEFNRQRWIRDRGTAFIKRTRHKFLNREFSAATAENIGKDLLERFPQATIFSFDQAGKLAFQTGKESKRSREIFWDGILAFQREHGGDPQNKRFQMADRFCKGLYGNLTTVSDLVDPDGLPQNFLEKGKTRYSWVLPQELLTTSKDTWPALNGPLPSSHKTTTGPMVLRPENEPKNHVPREIRSGPMVLRPENEPKNHVPARDGVVAAKPPDGTAFADPSCGSGGIWLQINPALLPAGRIAELALKNFPEVADTVMIVKNFHGKPRLERKRGAGRILAATAKKFFLGETECEDQYGFWVGRYIPGESGRFLIAGVYARNLEGFFVQWGRSLKIGYFLLALLASFIAYRLFWRGLPSGLNLRDQVFILFGIVAVFPLAAVVFTGLDLARDNTLRSRNAWEQRIKAVLDGIDSGSLFFRQEQVKKLASIEEAFAKHLPLSENSGPELQRLCGDMDKFEALVIDENGAKLNISQSLEKIQKRGEYPSYMARYLARLVEIEGRVPNSALANASTLLPEHTLENILNLLFRRHENFDRLRVRNTTLLQKKSILSRPGTQPTETLGLISWLFDEAEFTRDYAERTLKEASEDAPSKIVPSMAGTNRFHSIKIGFAAPGGKIYPPELEASPKLRIMIERVGKFQSSETGVVPFLDGKSYLTTVLFPVRMGGLLLIGMIETHESQGQIFDFEDLTRIIGFKKCLPLEKDRIFALQVLFLSVLMSLVLMIPMAGILSRWIVGRIRDLQGMVEEIDRNHLEVRAEIPADDELGDLALAFNEMAGGLQERERMSRFVSDQVLEEVKKDDSESLALGGEKREVAVLFTHIHHFNDLLEANSPENIIERLNEYFTVMNAPVKIHQGSIDKLIGDAIMAVFFPVPGLDHPALRAVRAAQEMLKEEIMFNKNREGAGKIIFRTDFGIHFGQAISGKVGAKHGMIDFTVIGDTVNTAARIQSAAALLEKASIVISEEVLKFLSPGVASLKLEQVSLKGKSQALSLYKLTE